MDWLLKSTSCNLIPTLMWQDVCHKCVVQRTEEEVVF